MHRTSSIFYLSDYSIRRPISSILQFFSDLKCCLDRIRKGKGPVGDRYLVSERHAGHVGRV